jgi:hypothetical protein
MLFWRSFSWMAAPEYMIGVSLSLG